MSRELPGVVVAFYAPLLDDVKAPRCGSVHSMAAPSKVSDFPPQAHRLKYARRLRALADQICAPGGADVGDIVLIYVDSSGLIHQESLLATQIERHLRMAGLLAAVQARLVDTFNYACVCGGERDRDA